MHSLRIGGATALLAAGCPAMVIQSLGRWSSDTYRLYCRSNTADVLHWQRALGRQHVNPSESAEDMLRRHHIPIEDLSNETPPRRIDPDDDIAADFDPDDVDVVVGVDPSGRCFVREVLDGDVVTAEHILRRFGGVYGLASEGALPT